MSDENTTEQIDENSDLSGENTDTLISDEVKVFESSEDAEALKSEATEGTLRQLSRKEYFQLTMGAYMALLPALLVIVVIFLIAFVVVRFVW